MRHEFKHLQQDFNGFRMISGVHCRFCIGVTAVSKKVARRPKGRVRVWGQGICPVCGSKIPRACSDWMESSNRSELAQIQKVRAFSDAKPHTLLLKML